MLGLRDCVLGRWRRRLAGCGVFYQRAISDRPQARHAAHAHVGTGLDATAAGRQGHSCGEAFDERIGFGADRANDTRRSDELAALERDSFPVDSSCARTEADVDAALRHPLSGHEAQFVRHLKQQAAGILQDRDSEFLAAYELVVVPDVVGNVPGVVEG